MSAHAVVRARVDGHLKEEASTVLSSMGLSLSDAIRMMLVRVVADKAMPFEVKVPNSETAAAMRDSRNRVGVARFDTLDDLMVDLNADD